jgi:hypothetical protein
MQLHYLRWGLFPNKGDTYFRLLQLPATTEGAVELHDSG